MISHSFCRASSRKTGPNSRRICPSSVFFRHFVINTTWYLHSQVVCFSVSFVCIVCPFVNFERFTKTRLPYDSRSGQTPGVSPAKLEDLFCIRNAKPPCRPARFALACTHYGNIAQSARIHSTAADPAAGHRRAARNPPAQEPGLDGGGHYFVCAARSEEHTSELQSLRH